MGGGGGSGGVGFPSYNPPPVFSPSATSFGNPEASGVGGFPDGTAIVSGGAGVIWRVYKPE